jgi:hypothetical protein
MLVALKCLIDRPCHVEKVNLCDIEIVICKNLAIGDELTLVNVATIEIKSKLLSEPPLNRVHLSLVAERKMIDCVSEVERVSSHV